MQKAKALSEPSCKFSIRLKHLDDFGIGYLKSQTKFSYHPSNCSTIVKHSKHYMAVKAAWIWSRNINLTNNQLVTSVKISTGSS